MSRPKPASMRFVRALLGGERAQREADGRFALAVNGRMTRMDGALVTELVSAGVLAVDGAGCRATPEARTWLRRHMLPEDGFAAQHRVAKTSAEGVSINLSESPLARLATPGADGSAAFLSPHQVEAGERVRKLVDRGHLQPRMTMTYSHEVRAGRGGAGSGPADMGDMAIDSRQALDGLLRALPADCAGVVLDVCGLLKGLQLVEAERGWPRRSAKLVLRIGLEQLARQLGLSGVAMGVERGRSRVWIGEGGRPTEIG